MPSTAESVTTPPPRPPVASDVSVSAIMETPVAITLEAIDDGLPDPPVCLAILSLHFQEMVR